MGNLKKGNDDTMERKQSQVDRSMARQVCNPLTTIHRDALMVPKTYIFGVGETREFSSKEKQALNDVNEFSDRVNGRAVRPTKIREITRWLPNTDKWRHHFTVQDIVEAIMPYGCGVTYGEAIQCLDVAKECGVWDHRYDTPGGMMDRIRNTLWDFLKKYRKSISPTRNLRGEPLVEYQVMRAAIEIAKMRLQKRYDGNDEDLVSFLYDYDLILQAVYGIS